MISKKLLPNREGYMEVEDENGNRIYVETKERKEQIKIEELEQENKLLKAQIKAQSDREEFIEDCIAEIAMIVYS